MAGDQIWGCEAPRHRREDNITTSLKKQDVDWILLTHNRVKWCAFVNMMMNLHIP